MTIYLLTRWRMITTEKTSQKTEKVCFKCLKLKPLSDFYKHAQMKDGTLNKCKSCTKLDVHNHRHVTHRESVLEYDRLRAKHPHRISKSRAIQSRWRTQHPERRKAQILLGNAVKSGKILKLPCQECGEAAEAHHPDYSRPLSVVWLCPAHHKQLHANHEMNKQTVF